MDKGPDYTNQLRAFLKEARGLFETRIVNDVKALIEQGEAGDKAAQNIVLGIFNWIDRAVESTKRHNYVVCTSCKKAQFTEKAPPEAFIVCAPRCENPTTSFVGGLCKECLASKTPSDLVSLAKEVIPGVSELAKQPNTKEIGHA